MKIRELTIKVKDLEKQKIFYTKVFGFKLIQSSKNEFSISISFSKFKFVKSEFRCYVELSG